MKHLAATADTEETVSANDAPYRLRLHPCRIESRWHLIHHPVLAKTDPRLYKALCRWAIRHGWQLLADRRSNKARAQQVNCRRQWLSRLVVLAACFVEPAASHEASLQQIAAHTATPHTVNANSARLAALGGSENGAALQALERERHKEVRQILQDHWRSTPADPPSLSQDLDVLASYFSTFPEVRELLNALHGKKWRLQFAANTFATRVTGSRLSVSGVTVNFDPRSAAQYKFNNACAEKPAFCVAAPADVLLHELLHARQALLHPKDFLREGGFNPVLYPQQHEQQVIFKENGLYAAMSKVDQKPRPLRQEHSGRAITVACATCLY